MVNCETLCNPLKLDGDTHSNVLKNIIQFPNILHSIKAPSYEYRLVKFMFYIQLSFYSSDDSLTWHNILTVLGHDFQILRPQSISIVS